MQAHSGPEDACDDGASLEGSRASLDAAEDAADDGAELEGAEDGLDGLDDELGLDGLLGELGLDGLLGLLDELSAQPPPTCSSSQWSRASFGRSTLQILPLGI